VPPRAWRERVQDIIEAVERVLAYTNAMDFEAFTRDQKTIDAVVRNLEVIGEASLHVPGEIQERHAAIPWREMRAMRNLLSHAYFVTDSAVVWKTVREDLPVLVHHLREILDSDGGL
jgi:uncharacterized protein with HEPN domain